MKKKFKILTIFLLAILLMGAVGCSCSTPLTAQNGLEASNDRYVRNT